MCAVVNTDMYNSVIFVLLYCSFIDTKSADAVMVTSCYKLDSSWTDVLWRNFSENYSLCENLCKEASSTYTYYGISVEQCFCGKTIPTMSNNNGNNCTVQNGFRWLLTVSEIGKAFTTRFMDLINTDTSQSTIMKSTSTKKSITATSANAHTSISAESTLSTTDIEMSTSKEMRPRKLLCKCPKRLINTKWHFLDGKNITDDEVKKMVVKDFNKNIKSEISVDKKTVSKEVRKKNSSVNKRKSSQSIGSGCVVFLILPVVFLIVIDILNCCIHVQSRLGDRKRSRIGPTSDIQDSRDSSKPVHENVNITESHYASRCGSDFHPDEVKLETYRRRSDDNNEKDRDEWLQYM